MESNFKKVRRPDKKIDKDLVYKLACIQCTIEEIAEVVGTTTKNIRKKCGPLLQKGKEVGRRSLRRAQWDKAINGDTRMQIHLGKQYLGQKDNQKN